MSCGSAGNLIISIMEKHRTMINKLASEKTIEQLKQQCKLSNSLYRSDVVGLTTGRVTSRAEGEGERFILTRQTNNWEAWT